MPCGCRSEQAAAKQLRTGRPPVSPGKLSRRQRTTNVEANPLPDAVLQKGTAEAGRAEPGAGARYERRWIDAPNPKKFVSFGNKTDPTWNYPIKNSRC